MHDYNKTICDDYCTLREECKMVYEHFSLFLSYLLFWKKKQKKINR